MYKAVILRINLLRRFVALQNIRDALNAFHKTHINSIRNELRSEITVTRLALKEQPEMAVSDSWSGLDWLSKQIFD
jgi:hypothetical protein